MSKRPGGVAVVGPFPPLKGGISQHASSVADAIEASGHTVIRISWSHQYPKRLYGRNQYDEQATAHPQTQWLMSWRNPWTWFQAARRARSADIVVMPWVSPVHAPVQMFMLLLLGSQRVVFHVHNAMPHEKIPFSSPLARLVLRRADHIICHARSIADELHEMDISTPVSVVGLPPLQDVTAAPLPDAPPVRLLCLGTIRHYKGVDIAVDAADKLFRAGRDVTITVAGEVWDDDAWPPATLNNVAVPVDADLRYLPDDDVVTLLAEHHIVIASYRSATQSGVVPMAFAAGRPVVVTNVGGLAEAVEIGVNGTVAEEVTVQSVADAVDRAIDALDHLADGASRSAASWTGYAELVMSTNQ